MIFEGGVEVKDLAGANCNRCLALGVLLQLAREQGLAEHDASATVQTQLWQHVIQQCLSPQSSPCSRLLFFMHCGPVAEVLRLTGNNAQLSR